MNSLRAAFFLVFVISCGGDKDPADPTGGDGGPDTDAGATGTGGDFSATGGASSSGGTVADTGGTGSGTGGAGTAGAGGAPSGGSGGFEIRPDVGSGVCQEFTPCGGDPVGSWQALTCSDPPLAAYSIFCPAMTETVSVTATLNFGADGSISGESVFSVQGTIPADCASQWPSGCDAFVLCTANPNGSCDCDSDEVTPIDASYTLDPENNRMISVDNADGQADTIYYCREGDRMLMRGQNASGQIFVYDLTRIP